MYLVNIAKKLFPYFLFLYLIFAINSPPYLYTEKNFIHLIKFLLGISPILLFFFCISFLIYKKKNYEIDKKSKLFIFYLLFCFFQIYAVINEKLDDYLHSIYWIVASMSLPIFLYTFDYVDKKNKDIFYKIFLFVITIVSSLYLFNLFSSYLFSNVVNFSFYGNIALDPNTLIMQSHIPRSSGMARFCALLFILFHLIHDYYNFRNKYFKLIIKLIAIFLLFTTIHLQSRIIIVFFVIYGVFYLLPFHKELFRNRLKNILIIYLAAVFLHLSFPVMMSKIKFSYLNLDFNEGLIHSSLIDIVTTINKDSLDIKLSDNNNMNEDSVDNKNNLGELVWDYTTFVTKGRMNQEINSSGRISLWKKSKKFIKTNPIFGKGPQADRRYIGENISNLYIYSIICGGIFGLISILIFIFSIIYKSFKETFILSEFKKEGNIIKKFSLYCIGFLLIRSMAENSFGIFGIDYFLFLLSANKLYQN